MLRKPILLCLGDVHIRHTVPVSRAEKCWYEVMTRRFDQLKAIQKQLGMVPILVAGDLVDRFNLPSSIVSWALDNVPHVYSCVGQHDLENWQYGSRFNGTYGAMVKAGIVTDLTAETWTSIPGDTPTNVWSLPWGFEAAPTDTPDGVKVAAIHRYVWTSNKNKHYGATEKSCITALSPLIRHFSVLVTADNHCQFRAGRVYNSGSLFATTSAQQEHVPHLCVVYSDGTAESIPFPEEREWQPNLDTTPTEVSKSVVEYLQTTDNAQVNFRESLRRLSEEATDHSQRQVYRNLNDLLAE
jgi:hypothetical protein